MTTRQGASVSGAVTSILTATVVAGAAGYVLNAVVPMRVRPASYADFSVIWSILFFVIAALSGVQQEVTRAASPRPNGNREANPAARFALTGAIIVTAVLGLAGFFGLPALLGAQARGAVIPLAIGAGAYVVVAVLTGLLYGLSSWRLIAFSIAADGVLRLLLVLVALALHVDLAGLFYAVALPFPVIPIVVLAIGSGRIRGRARLDVAVPALTWNATRAVLASGASALLISGFPLVLAITSIGVPKASLASVNLAISLARAPLVTVVLALQSLLIVRFRDARGSVRRVFTLAAVALIFVAALVGIIAALLGPWLLGLFGGGYHLDGWFIGVLVFSSGLLGVLCMTGTLAMARNRHTAYLWGWVTAAAVTILALLLPLSIEPRVCIALIVGSVAGSGVHLVLIRRSKLGSARSAGGPSPGQITFS